MTTQKMYETVLEQFGFTIKPWSFGRNPSMRLKKGIGITGSICFADFRRRHKKTFIHFSGAVFGYDINTGWLCLSEMQLRYMLPILLKKPF